MKHYSVALLLKLSKTQQRRTTRIKNSCRIVAIFHSRQQPLLASRQPYKLAVPPKEKHVFNVVETGKMWQVEITEIMQSNILMSFWTLECRRASPPVVSIHDVKCRQSPSGRLGGKNKKDNRVEMRRKKNKTTELQNISEQFHAITREFSHNNRKRPRYLLSPLRRFRAQVRSCSTKHSTRDLLGQIPTPLPSNTRLIRLNNCKSCSFP